MCTVAPSGRITPTLVPESSPARARTAASSDERRSYWAQVSARSPDGPATMYAGWSGRDAAWPATTWARVRVPHQPAST